MVRLVTRCEGDAGMSDRNHLIRVDFALSAVMFFSMGCLFGAYHSGIPFLVWIIVIFIGACAKIWLRHRDQKLRKSGQQKRT